MHSAVCSWPIVQVARDSNQILWQCELQGEIWEWWNEDPAPGMATARPESRRITRGVCRLVSVVGSDPALGEHKVTPPIDDRLPRVGEEGFG
jgi:hypothetical protein